MKKIKLKSRKLLRTIFCIISLATVAFICQDCDIRIPGADVECTIRLTGTVQSKTTNLPIKGIRIAINNNQYKVTDENGNFDFYVFVSRLGGGNSPYDNFYKVDSIKVDFLDIDGSENGNFSDTTIIVNPGRISEVAIFMEMKEKQ